MNKKSVENNPLIDIESKINEDIELIDLIDGFFIKKRGYVIKIPPAGTPVCACMSGGLDSTANISILLDKFKLKVYPFFVNRGQSNYAYEKKSVEYYNKFFSKRYPDLYNECFEIKLDTPSPSYKHMLTEELKNNHIGYPARNTMIFLAGAEYAYSLKSIGVKISTIFGATVVSDTLFHSSLTWTRVTNLSICQFLNDYSWQLISIPIERESGNSYDKDVLIKFCNKRNIPLRFTRTCTEKDELQCGKCICCFDRRRCFGEARVKDDTQYKGDV